MEHDNSYKLLFLEPEIVTDLLKGFVNEPWTAKSELNQLILDLPTGFNKYKSTLSYLILDEDGLENMSEIVIDSDNQKILLENMQYLIKKVTLNWTNYMPSF